MVKRISFIVFTGLVFSLAALLFVFAAEKKNHVRIQNANELESKAEVTTDAQNKLIYLAESDLLVPNDAKKIKIATLYFADGDNTKAESYLNRIKSQEGTLIKIEYLLQTGKLELAEANIKKLKNQSLVSEFSTYLNVPRGTFEVAKDIPTSPATDSGKLISCLNLRICTPLTQKLPISDAINKILGKRLNQLTTVTEISSLFIQNQPNLALFGLQNVRAQADSKEVESLIARSYAAKNDTRKALEAQRVAIEFDIADINLYKDALTYARKAGRNAEADAFAEKIRYLSSIK